MYIQVAPRSLLDTQGDRWRCSAGWRRGKWESHRLPFQDELGSTSSASITVRAFRIPWKCQWSWPFLSPHQSMLRWMRRNRCGLAGQATEHGVLVCSLPFIGYYVPVLHRSCQLPAVSYRFQTYPAWIKDQRDTPAPSLPQLSFSADSTSGHWEEGWVIRHRLPRVSTAPSPA